MSKALNVSNLIITSGSEGQSIKCGIHGRKNLGAVGGAILETFECRYKNTRDRTPDIIGGEAGETSTPAKFAADDGADTPTVFGRFLERE